MKAVTIAMDFITDDMRQQLIDSAQKFEIAVNEALAPYQVKFVPGQSLSQMVKESPLYQAFSDKQKESQFFNKVKSKAKALRLGEGLTIMDFITDDMRQQLIDSAQTFEIAVNEAFAPYQVKFVSGKSLSQMVKESPLYQAFDDNKKKSQFFNEVKSQAAPFKLGEVLTVESIFSAMRRERPTFTVIGKEKPRGPVYTVRGMKKPWGISENLWATFIQQGFVWGTMRPQEVSRKVWFKMLAAIISYNKRLGVINVGDSMKAWAKERESMRWHESDVASRQQKKTK